MPKSETDRIKWVMRPNLSMTLLSWLHASATEHAVDHNSAWDFWDGRLPTGHPSRARSDEYTRRLAPSWRWAP